MTFSIRYNSKHSEAYTEYAVDWDWKFRNQWARSEKDGIKWYPMEGLDKESYRAIIRKFGLEEERKTLTLEKIITISPKKLGRMRRKKEKSEGLPYKEIISDTVGDHERIA